MLEIALICLSEKCLRVLKQANQERNTNLRKYTLNSANAKLFQLTVSGYGHTSNTCEWLLPRRNLLASQRKYIMQGGHQKNN
jgi:hypothetical protein